MHSERNVISRRLFFRVYLKMKLLNGVVSDDTFGIHLEILKKFIEVHIDEQFSKEIRNEIEFCNEKQD